jgi:prevent-host-death family protein
MTERSVGVRDLKARPSEYLRAVKSGETIEITERGKVVARLSPATASRDERLHAMVAAGLADWSGKPLPPVPAAPRVRGDKTVSEILIENRE